MEALSMDVLSKQETQLILDDLMGRMHQISSKREPTPEDHYMVYAEVLSDWGVMCPHPTERRLYNGEKSFVEVKDARWFQCRMCNCAVINPAFEGEPRPFERRTKMFAPKLRKTNPPGDPGGNSAA